MRMKRFRRLYPVIAAAVMAMAFVPAVSLAATGGTSASGPGPVRARITGAVIPGSATAATVAAAAPGGGLPTKQAQIKRLTAALAYMQKHYKTLAGSTPGVQDIDDYGIGTLWRKGIDGAGTTIAVIEGWNLGNIGQIVAGFDKQFDLPAPPSLRTIYPAGPLPKTCPAGMVKLGSYGSCDAWGGELALDVVTAHMIAPYAKIVISATPADTEVKDDPASNVAPPEMMKALEVISRQHLANVISISDGTGETTYSYGRAQILANSPGELAAAAAGIPVLVATGDCGVVQNLAVANAQCNNTSATPDTAAWDDSPWVTAVGGSVPDFSFTTPQRLGPDPLWNVGGLFSEGAGFSSVFTRPGYQDGVAGITGSPMRSVPDITMDAQDGTSEAAPMLAGVLSLATQLNGGNIGPINPVLYRELGPAGARAGIADVDSGNDSVVRNGKVAVPGFTAGRGVRRGKRLGHGLRAQVRAQPGRRHEGGRPGTGRPAAGAGRAQAAGAAGHRAVADEYRELLPARQRIPADPPGAAVHRRKAHRQAHRQHARRRHLHDRPGAAAPREGTARRHARQHAHTRGGWIHRGVTGLTAKAPPGRACRPAASRFQSTGSGAEERGGRGVRPPPGRRARGVEGGWTGTGR